MKHTTQSYQQVLQIRCFLLLLLITKPQNNLFQKSYYLASVQYSYAMLFCTIQKYKHIYLHKYMFFILRLVMYIYKVIRATRYNPYHVCSIRAAYRHTDCALSARICVMGVINGANFILKKSINTDSIMHAVRIYIIEKTDCGWLFLSASNVFCKYHHNSQQTLIMHSTITCVDRKNTVLINVIIIIKR